VSRYNCIMFKSDRKNRRELQSLIIKLSDITEPIAATEQIACHTGRILNSGMSTRMVFASHYRMYNRCNVWPIGIVAVRGVEICFNAQPALVDGAGPLKVRSRVRTHGAFPMRLIHGVNARGMQIKRCSSETRKGGAKCDEAE